MHHLPPWTDYAYSREVVLAFADDTDLLEYLAHDGVGETRAPPSPPSQPVVAEKKPGPMATTTSTRCRIIRRPSKWSSRSSRLSRLMPPSSA